MLSILAAALAACPAPLADYDLLSAGVYQAIGDEIAHGLDATRDQDMDAYLATIPDDYYHIEEDGTRVDKAALEAMQREAWSIILRTNSIEQHITGFELSCDGQSATVWTDQRWDRQMRGRDGTSEHNVVTTQRHRETWRLSGSRWVNADLEELGGTVIVDGEPYD